MSAPIATFEPFSLSEANALLIEWGHKIGPMSRPMGRQDAHALVVMGAPVAVTLTADLIRETVAGAPYLTRQSCVELARLCAAGPEWNRVALRLWREIVLPLTGKAYGVSYQDAAMHNGNLYRFDGWSRVSFSHSGRDARSGRQGRNKWVWVWPRPGGDA